VPIGPLMRPALCATVAVLAALTLAACGGSSAPIPQPSAAVGVGAGVLTRAADASSAAKGYRFVMAMTETLPQGAITATGMGAFNRSPAFDQVNMTMNVPGLSTPLHIFETIDHGVLYMKLPASLLAQLPSAAARRLFGDKQWMALSFNQIGKAEGIPGLGSLLSDGSSTTNPASSLAALKHVADVTRVGQQTLLGVQTTVYRARVSLAAAFRALPGHTNDQAFLAFMRRKDETLSTSPEEVWIDGAGLVRRTTQAMTITVQGQAIKINIQMDMLAYGPQPAPTIPSPSETFNLSRLITSHLGGL
jgi:hypothetical protein